MAIEQEAFYIPDNIMMKILTGEYTRIGGVVRHAIGPNKGQIVKHLKPVKVKNTNQAMGVGAKMLKFAKKNKKALIIVGVIAGVSALGAGIYTKFNNKEQEVVVKFKKSLREYISAIRLGKMDIDVIDNLMIALNELKKSKDYDKINIKLTIEELDVLVNRIYEYTVRLAKDNIVELTDEEKEDSGSTIINLQKYLQAQKRIFKVA